jgi:hypothetical protein
MTESKRNSDQQEEPLPTYLLLENDRKSNNLGPVLRCAAAYGISTVLAIGFSQCSVQGSHGASKHVTIVAFPTVDQAIASIHHDRRRISVVGILGGVPMNSGMNSILDVQRDDDASVLCVSSEESEQSKPLQPKKQSYPVGSNWVELSKIHCFAFCKSKRGLSSLLACHCDRFVHIPHRSMGGDFAKSSLLDLPSCMSIVLHHYTTRAGYDERTFKGHKFELQRAQQGEMEQQEERRNRREEAKKKQWEEMLLESEDPQTLGTGIFGDKNDNGDY